MILNDKEITYECIENGMITPFISAQTKVGKVSYGLSSFGYDFRVSFDSFKVFRHIPGKVVDVKNFCSEFLLDEKSDSQGRFIIPHHSYALCVSIEKFKIPEDVVGVCVGKSTYARAGIIVNVTPLEPGWQGYLTIEISNSSDSDVYIYAAEGIAQAQFFRGARPETTYSDRKGKYQNQEAEVTEPRI